MLTGARSPDSGKAEADITLSPYLQQAMPDGLGAICQVMSPLFNQFGHTHQLVC